MRRVVLESPYAGDIEANVAYARRCLHDCLARGEAPIASHLLFTQPGVLDDTKPEERSLGMRAGFAWYEVAEASAVYLDRGLSSGMKAGLGIAAKRRIPIELRFLDRTVPRPIAADALVFAHGIEAEAAKAARRRCLVCGVLALDHRGFPTDHPPIVPTTDATLETDLRRSIIRSV